MKKAAQGYKRSAVQFNFASYNLALVYFALDDKDSFLNQVGQFLAEDSPAIKQLCLDGQFRRMHHDKKIGERFDEMVNAASKSNGLESCWVTR